jgi:hypothetical protein
VLYGRHRQATAVSAAGNRWEVVLIYAGGADDDGNIYLGMNGNKGVERYAIR